MKTLVLANRKGGVGKSAIGCQFAYYLILLGYRVLFIDFDHQKNSTKSIIKSGKAVAANFTATQLLAGEATPLPDGRFVLVQGDDTLSNTERQHEKHNNFVNALKIFLEDVAGQFDFCVMDTNPNPDIRYVAALVTSDFVLSPIQLNQEAIDGIGALLNHPRYGLRKIKATLNPGLDLIGVLPNMVEPTPFQRSNFQQLAESFSQLLIGLDGSKQRFAFIPKRSVIAEAQADGSFLAEVKKTAGRDAWREIKPSFDIILQRIMNIKTEV